MSVNKHEFANDVVRIIHDMCKLVFNVSNDAEVKTVLGMTNEQMDKVMQKIIEAIPDQFFQKMYPHSLDEIKNICAREFIFFQVQEKCDDPQYHADLANFIYAFTRDIQHQI